MDSNTICGSQSAGNSSRRKGKSVDSRVAAKWSDANTATLIEACAKVVRAGSRPGGKFDHSGWVRVVEHFKCQTDNDYTKMQLKNRLDGLKREWLQWTTLNRGETGLGWDNIRKTVSVELGWWAKQIQETPSVAKFRSKGPLLKELQAEIFDGVVATGSRSFAPSSGNLPDIEQIREGSGETDPDAIANPVTTNDYTPLNSDELAHVTPPAKSSLIIKKHKRLRSAESIAQSLDTMAATGRMRLEARTERPSYAITECMASLHALLGITHGSPLWFMATELFADAIQRELYMVIPTDDLRLQWLHEKLFRHKSQTRPYTHNSVPFHEARSNFEDIS